MGLSEAQCYGAVAGQDDRFDGLFFSGIVTTGVYCRPVCPVPQPAKRENIRFYPSSVAAEGAGFRPCRRCHPERAASIGVWSGVPAVVSRALNLIAEGALDGDNGVDVLARRVGIGSRQLRRLFRTHLGASPVAIAKARRVNFGRRLLDETELPIARVALAAGFRSVRQFNHDVRRTFGRTPTELRRSSKGARTGSEQLVVRLPYRPPLDWARAIAFLQQRATPGVEVVEHDRYRRTVRVNGSPAVIELRLVADEPYLLLTLRPATAMPLVGVVERAQRIFDLAADPVAIGVHLSQSRELSKLVLRRPGMRVPGAWDGFEVAVRAILDQEFTGRAAGALAARMVAGLGEPHEAGDGLTHLFPTPVTLANADLRPIGATHEQARSIRSLSAAIAGGELTIEAPTGLDEFVERMCRVAGVGPSTAHYVAMRACGEPDAFPAGDLALRRAAGNGVPLSPPELSSRAEAWRPWRSYAAMYLWSRDRSRQPGDGAWNAASSGTPTE